MDLYQVFQALNEESNNLIELYQEMILAETTDTEYGQLVKARLLAIRLYMGFILETYKKAA